MAIRNTPCETLKGKDCFESCKIQHHHYVLSPSPNTYIHTPVLFSPGHCCSVALELRLGHTAELCPLYFSRQIIQHLAIQQPYSGHSCGSHEGILIKGAFTEITKSHHIILRLSESHFSLSEGVGCTAYLGLVAPEDKWLHNLTSLFHLFSVVAGLFHLLVGLGREGGR